MNKIVFLLYNIGFVFYYNNNTPFFLRNLVLNAIFCLNILFVFLKNYFIFYYKKLNNEYWLDNKKCLNNINGIETIIKTSKITPKKYEDKYLDIIRSLDKEWKFTKEEMTEINSLTEDFFNKYNKNMMYENNKKNNDLKILKLEIIEDIDDVDYCEEWDETEGLVEETTFIIRNEKREKQIKKIQDELNEYEKDIKEGCVKLKMQFNNEAKQIIITKKLNKLENNYVMESTPTGNVLMMYDVIKGSFKYYADSNIPYKYLDVVGRKYVKVLNCRPIFVDIEEELLLFKEKEKEEKEEKEKEENKKEENEKLFEKNEIKIKPEEKKKNVFAKFKNYNKNIGTKISMAAAPPKNSIPNKNNSENTKLVLKSNTNRYTYAGKYSNFNFIKKVDKKIFNKKLSISFADFKKINKQ